MSTCKRSVDIHLSNRPHQFKIDALSTALSIEHPIVSHAQLVESLASKASLLHPFRQQAYTGLLVDNGLMLISVKKLQHATNNDVTKGRSYLFNRIRLGPLKYG